MTTELPADAGARLVLRIAGAGLLIATAAVHLDLYLTGYQTIPTIGWLFLLQVVVGAVLALAVLVTGSRLVAASGALFALSTLGGYLLSVQFGLFGFREVRTTAGIVAAVLEVAAFVVLAVFAATPAAVRAAGSTRSSGLASLSSLAARARDGVGGRTAGLGAAAVAVVAFALLGGALAGSGGAFAGGQAGSGVQASSAAAGSGLRTADIGGTRVLTNSQGRTLYWFAPDTSTRSVCTGSCAAYWPPVSGPLTASVSLHGKLGTIRRADGSVQETYNGHPLYTYVGDAGPGQAHGNNLNLNGGLWHEVVVTG